MRIYNEAKKSYIADHNSKTLVQPQRRLNALEAIERTFDEQSPDALHDTNLFANNDKKYFLTLYERLKGSALSSAEKFAITGLYKFSK